MVTDPPPRPRELRRQYDASDDTHTLPLPPAAPLQHLTGELAAALASGHAPGVESVGQQLLDELATFYALPSPTLRVLGVRPHRTREGRLAVELHGDYDLETAAIRAWMRTAIHGRITSHRGFLNTLIHEFCHHLDVRRLGWPSTPHTRGFYARVDDLYHLALATPAAARRPLAWIPRGSAWQVDWRKLRTPVRMRGHPR